MGKRKYNERQMVMINFISSQKAAGVKKIPLEAVVDHLAGLGWLDMVEPSNHRHTVRIGMRDLIKKLSLSGVRIRISGKPGRGHKTEYSI